MLGKGKILLKLSSGKTLSLSDVLYVLLKSIVFGSLLNRVRLKLVFEGDKVVITKNVDFVGKGYLLVHGLFAMNSISVASNVDKLVGCAYIVESVDLWSDRPRHVNVAYIKKLNIYMELTIVSNANNK